MTPKLKSARMKPCAIAEEGDQCLIADRKEEPKARVAAEKDYSIRARKQSEDELGQLFDRFNDMLGQIQVRDHALQKTQDDLEHRVQNRTAELSKANDLLKAEVAERERVEQRLLTQHAVTLVLTEADTLRQAAPQIIQAVCETLDWEMGAVWSVDRSANVLRCVDTWHKPSLEAVEFEAATRERTFAPGIELPGRVRAEGA